MTREPSARPRATMMRLQAKRASLALAALVVGLAPVGITGTADATPIPSPVQIRPHDEVSQRDLARAHRRQATARVLQGVKIARAQVGDRYVYGSAGPSTFDCSGLTYYSFRQEGFDIPRSSGAQAGWTRRIAKSQMRPGDLMFFADRGGVYHVAIFVGRNRDGVLMLHAPKPGRSVVIEHPWTSAWFAGTLRGKQPAAA